jgi:hypothetical protein
MNIIEHVKIKQMPCDAERMYLRYTAHTQLLAAITDKSS